MGAFAHVLLRKIPHLCFLLDSIRLFCLVLLPLVVCDSEVCLFVFSFFPGRGAHAEYG